MMIRGFGRSEHGSRRLEDFDAEDNEVDETMVGALCCSTTYTMYVSIMVSFHAATKLIWTRIRQVISIVIL